MRLIFLSLIAHICCVASISAQDDLKRGQWRSYLPYHFGTYVTQSDDAVYFTTEISLLKFHKDVYEIEYIAKTEGLSDAGTGVIKYNRFNDQLLITYANGNIDILKKDGTVINFNNLLVNNNLTGDKRVRDIYIESAIYGYLACSFGIIQYNFERNEFGFTVFTGLNVNGITALNNHLYIATDNGIYSASQNTNLQDFNNWQRLTENLPQNYSSKAITHFNNTIYADVNDTLYQITDAGAISVHHEPSFTIKYLTAEGSHLLLGLDNTQPAIDDKMLIFNTDNTFRLPTNYCVNQTLYAIESLENDVLWFADQYAAFRYGSPELSECYRAEFNSPKTHNSSDIKVIDDEVWVAAGGMSAQGTSVYRADGLFVLKEGIWDDYNRYDDPQLFEKRAHLDWLYLAQHPQTKKMCIATFSGGLVTFDGAAFEVFNEANSSLQIGLNTGANLVTGLAFDTDNNLWLSNYLAPKPISVWKNDGQWRSFFTPCGGTTATSQLLVDNNGYKWVALGEGQGLLVWDSGQDINNTADDRCRIINKGNSVLPNNQITTLGIDLDGDVWVGTPEGVIAFECGSNILDDNCTGSRRILRQDEFDGYLLETEFIRCVAVDGANRKWFGTTNGVFVISPNGDELVAKFNVQNSPLPDNIINTIGVNNRNGEVFIGTEKGIVSYRGDATAGVKAHNKSNVVAYPNPVRPEYNGDIAIKGLTRNANVKITNITGQVVFETTALGGQAIWDGRDLSGKRVATGVYWVFSTNTQQLEDTDAIVTKILFIN